MHPHRVGHARDAGPQPRQVGRPRRAAQEVWGPAYAKETHYLHGCTWPSCGASSKTIRRTRVICSPRPGWLPLRGVIPAGARDAVTGHQIPLTHRQTRTIVLHRACRPGREGDDRRRFPCRFPGSTPVAVPVVATPRRWAPLPQHRQRLPRQARSLISARSGTPRMTAPLLRTNTVVCPPRAGLHFVAGVGMTALGALWAARRPP